MSNEKPLSAEEFATLRNYQDGGCALCGKVSNNLVLDHDHASMLIRGLLCNECNLRLGEYERKRRLFKHYEAYLQEFPMRALDMYIMYKPATENRREEKEA